MSETQKKPNSDDLVDIGEEHHKAGRLQEAEAHYRNALEIDPGHPGALYYLANIAYEDERLSFATQLIEELLAGEPNDAEAWHLLGQVAYKGEDFLRASECFKKALAIQPGYALAYYSLGNALNSRGDIDNALINFQRAVALNPAFVEAYRSIGNIFHAQNKFEEAVKNYQQAISVKPDFKLAYEGVGGILLSQEKWDEAIAIYRKAIAENAGSAMIYVGLGVAHSNKKQSFDACAEFERAILLDANCFLAHFHLGDELSKQGKFNEAAISYKRASKLNPQDTYLLEKLAQILLYRLQEFDKAAEVYKQWLALEPDNAVARHYIAACTGESVPMRAEDGYVERTFDAFAETFDVTLNQLNYHGPEMLADALRRTCGNPNKQFAILDAGCGTGMVGPLVVEYANQLTGVDLSAGMLAKAKLRHVYDELIKAELTGYLQSQVAAFDIILAADTFIYFGALTDLITAARSAIRNDGYFFFTVESFIGDDNTGNTELGYRLNPHGRYSHNEAYLGHTLNKSGFTIVEIETVMLRHEGLRPVEGLVFSCRAV